jgi:hypothetical protein
MYDTMEDVSQRVSLNFLARTCKRYDMPGVFMEHNTSYDSKESGLYFITGIDKKSVLQKNYNPAELIANQERNKNYFQPIKAFKVSNCDPEVVQAQVAMYCWYAEFVAEVFPQFNMKIYNNLLQSKVESLAELYSQTHNPEFSEAARERFQTQFRNSINALKETYELRGLKKKWMDFTVSNRYDNLKGKYRNLVNFIRRKRNRVSKGVLLTNALGTTNMTMELWKYKEFVKQLKKYPEAIYYKYPHINTDVIGTVKPGKKPPRNGLYKYVSIMFPTEHETHIALAFDEAVYMPEASCSAEEIIQSKKPINAIVLPSTQIANYQNLFDANKVTYAIDTGYINHPMLEHVPILFYDKDTPTVMAIANRICNSSSSYHFIENNEAGAMYLQEVMYGDSVDMEKMEDDTKRIAAHEKLMRDGTTKNTREIGQYR